MNLETMVGNADFVVDQPQREWESGGAFSAAK
jgi:hypothetical protein